MTHFLVRMHVAGEQCRDRVLDLGVGCGTGFQGCQYRLTHFLVRMHVAGE